MELEVSFSIKLHRLLTADKVHLSINNIWRGDLTGDCIAKQGEMGLMGEMGGMVARW